MAQGLRDLFRTLVHVGPFAVFVVLLLSHSAEVVACMVTGAVAALSKKTHGRHSRFGKIYPLLSWHPQQECPCSVGRETPTSRIMGDSVGAGPALVVTAVHEPFHDDFIAATRTTGNAPVEPLRLLFHRTLPQWNLAF